MVSPLRKRKFAPTGPRDAGTLGAMSLLYSIKDEVEKKLPLGTLPINTWVNYPSAIDYTFTDSGVFMVTHSMLFAKLAYAETAVGFRYALFEDNTRLNVSDIVSVYQGTSPYDTNQSANGSFRNWKQPSNAFDTTRLGNHSQIYSSAIISATAGNTLGLQAFRASVVVADPYLSIKYEKLSIIQINTQTP